MSEAHPASIVVQRRVEWMDTDAAGHYHHSTVLRWVEAAEMVLHERLGLVELMGVIPRVRYEVDYSDRLYYGDVVDVEYRTEQLGTSSGRFGFEVRRTGEKVAASGQLVIVHVDAGTGSSTPWSDHARKLLQEAGPQQPELLG